MSYRSWMRFVLLAGIPLVIALSLVWAIPRQGLAPTGSGKPSTSTPRSSGVCPPFKLKDEQGNVIDPTHGINDTAPYSPRQTCGTTGCHDYEKVTRGFHFTQGKGEAMEPSFASRYQWVTSPGNYGGNWCSPAPLYRQLAAKENKSARTIDMTSFDFVTATCGNCHPGGGPLEFDRKGQRYDTHMMSTGMISGGENGLDGDYFKAKWDKTGVLEADCLLCHQPEYDAKKRNAQLANLNFKWAATEGAGFGVVEGKVSEEATPKVVYDKSRFDADGNITLHIAPEPRNSACLNCHAKPDWKKRGASYTERTDVHMRAGLRCVDCHTAGEKASDPRIRGREEHQFGKGDDPSGWVRNDLDDTVRSCAQCHLEGWNNAPRASHAWLPSLHLQKLSCQACHIPERSVKSALVQASDVFNPAPRISPPAKHIWTFYDQDMKFWNHYGELDLFTVKDQPTDLFHPTLIRYKGKIYPANRVHSTWVGFEEAGKSGLNQLFMRDFFGMWKEHKADPQKNWPRLAIIRDENGDGLPEINRPEEIDAVLAETKAYLEKTGFPLLGRRLVWVSDSRAYYSSGEWKDHPHEGFEATAYASVYKYSHDVAPAKAALGSGGCVDCHSNRSTFFFGAVLDQPFNGSEAKATWMPNYKILGYSSVMVRLGALREQVLKPLLFALIFLSSILLGLIGVERILVGHFDWERRRAGILLVTACLALVLAASWLARTPDLLEYMTVRRFTLDAAHFPISLSVIALALALGLMLRSKRWDIGHVWVERSIWGLMAFTALCGGSMLIKFSWLENLMRLGYSGFDLGLVLLMLASCAILGWRLGHPWLGSNLKPTTK